MALTAAALLLAPATAQGASATTHQGKLTYTGASFEANRLVASYNPAGAVTLTETGRVGALPVLIATNGNCRGWGRIVTCSGVSSVVVNTGDGGDQVDTSALALPTIVTTGDGDDRVTTGAGADTLTAGGGDDVLDGGLGGDVLNGGAGEADTVSYATRDASSPVAASLDGIQNDGCASCGESDRIGADVEALAGGAGDDSLTGGTTADVIAGGDGDDTLSGGDGGDSIDGGNGTDIVDGGGGDDRLATRDATPDQLACGAGADGGDADHEDAIDADCESVVRAERSADTDVQDPGATTPSDPVADPSDEPAPFNLAAPVIPRQAAAVTASGVALVRVACPVESGGCAGRVELLLLGDAGKAKVVAARRRRMRKVGSKRFKAEAGTKPVVQVRLNRRGRRRMRRRGRTRCFMRVTTRTADGRVVTTSREITLRARRAARGRKR
jgi:hypothetical protein